MGLGLTMVEMEEAVLAGIVVEAIGLLVSEGFILGVMILKYA